MDDDRRSIRRLSRQASSDHPIRYYYCMHELGKTLQGLYRRHTVYSSILSPLASLFSSPLDFCFRLFHLFNFRELKKVTMASSSLNREESSSHSHTLHIPFATAVPIRKEYNSENYGSMHHYHDTRNNSGGSNNLGAALGGFAVATYLGDMMGSRPEVGDNNNNNEVIIVGHDNFDSDGRYDWSRVMEKCIMLFICNFAVIIVLVVISILVHLLEVLQLRLSLEI